MDRLEIDDLDLFYLTTGQGRWYNAEEQNCMNKRKKTPRKETMKQVYARLRREFSAADLQKYTVMERGVPAEKVLADMVKIHQQTHRKQQVD